MITLILSFLCLSLGLVALALQRLYSSVPAYELKRLSGAGDPIAHELYRPVAHGANLRLLLWSVVVVGFSGSLVLLMQAVPVLVSVTLTAIVLVLGFVWLPSLRLTTRTITFARWFAPTITFLLQRLHPVLQPVASFIKTHREFGAHSRIYEKEDLVALLHQQREQPDNRITHEDLELTHRALAFQDRLAADIATPRNQLFLVNADDTVGPILLDQLHKSGQVSFLVYKDTPETVVGALSLKDAIAAKQGGRVMDLVRPELAFVHEDFSLHQVLRTFQSTTQQMVVVINSFEEFVGTITMRQLLIELLGEQPQHDLSHDNRTAVAAFRREDARPPNVDDEVRDSEEPASSPEAPEVVK
jgi:CBS domain containing-hemolysin-like protein